jgi:hypothetical protein
VAGFEGFFEHLFSDVRGPGSDFATSRHIRFSRYIHDDRQNRLPTARPESPGPNDARLMRSATIITMRPIVRISQPHGTE